MSFDAISEVEGEEYKAESIERKGIKVFFHTCERMDEIPDNSVHLIFTSPPYYSMRGTMGYDNYNNFLKVMYRIFKRMYDVLRPGRHMMINISDYQVSTDLDKSNPDVNNADIGRKFDIPSHFSYLLWKLNKQYAEHHTLQYEDTITWEKPGSTSQRAGTFVESGNPLKFRPEEVTERILVFRKGQLDYTRVWREAQKSGRYDDWDITTKDKFEEKISVDPDKFRDFINTVWEISPETDSEHPAPFPVELPKKAIQLYSIERETVLDPFWGSGTTGEAAMQTDRKAVGYENFDAQEHSSMDFRETVINRLGLNSATLDAF